MLYRFTLFRYPWLLLPTCFRFLIERALNISSIDCYYYYQDSSTWCVKNESDGNGMMKWNEVNAIAEWVSEWIGRYGWRERKRVEKGKNENKSHRRKNENNFMLLIRRKNTFIVHLRNKQSSFLPLRLPHFLKECFMMLIERRYCLHFVHIYALMHGIWITVEMKPKFRQLFCAIRVYLGSRFCACWFADFDVYIQK